MATFDLDVFEPPRMITPLWWIAMPGDVKAELERSGTPFKTIGASAGGREIYGTIIGPKKPLFTFGVIGGTHGHESGGTAAVMNLLSAAVTGRNLAGSPADAIVSRVRWALIPLLNPDGREQDIKDPGYNHQQIIEGYLFILAAIAREFVKNTKSFTNTSKGLL